MVKSSILDEYEKKSKNNRVAMIGIACSSTSPTTVEAHQQCLALLASLAFCLTLVAA
jgi:hypothetical protein